MSEFENIVAEYPDSVSNSLPMIDTARLDEGSRSLYMVVKGEAECRLNDFNDTASAPFLSAARHYDLKEDKRRGGKAHFLAGQASFNAGVYDRAILEYMKAADRSMESGDTLWAAFARRGLAQSFEQLSDWAIALEYSRQAEQDFRLLGETSRAAYMKYHVARRLNAVGKHAESLCAADAALEEAGKSGDRWLKAYCYSVKGCDYLYLDNPDSSAFYYNLQAVTVPETISGIDYAYSGVAYAAVGSEASIVDTCRVRAERLGISTVEMDLIGAQDKDRYSVIEKLKEMVDSQRQNLYNLRNRTLVMTLDSYHKSEESALKENISAIHRSKRYMMICGGVVVFLLLVIFIIERKRYIMKLGMKAHLVDDLGEMLKNNEEEMAMLARTKAELEHRNSSLKSENIGLRSEMAMLYDRIVFVRGSVCSVLKDNNNIFKRFFEIYNTGIDSSKISSQLYDETQRAIADIRKENGMMQEWEKLVNRTLDNVIERFRTDFPNSPVWDVQILLLTILGFPPSLQAAVFDINITAMYSRKAALRKRIKESDSKYKEEYLGYLV